MANSGNDHDRRLEGEDGGRPILFRAASIGCAVVAKPWNVGSDVGAGDDGSEDWTRAPRGIGGSYTAYYENAERPSRAMRLILDERAL
ncbi:hypothetical protein T07_10782 [Trichinella nelsoni]|uniref:Uncharacterized protein n=1 Tax=Trichinella nelsoni TaxID=6336 RepID=A0A0V0S020_9BILA|nr:hypothetical protein T07_10782 [Trichinella nelsoni]